MKKIALLFLTLNFYTFAQTPIGIQWQKCLGGSNNENGYSIIQSSDGGFISVGSTMSNDGDVSGNHYATDVWVVKTSNNGIIEWQKCLGGTGLMSGIPEADVDIGFKIIQTSDGGYIICGVTSSNDGNVTGNHGGSDVWVVKLNSVGIIQWQKCYGGTADEIGIDIIQTIDGGYVFSGFTSSNNGDVLGNHGGSDIWVVKLNSSGIIQWQKCFGGTNDESFNFDSNNIRKILSIKKTTDGGFVVSGVTNSINGDITLNNGQNDLWVIKISSLGVLQWQKCFGGTGDDVATDILQTNDGGYVFTGFTNSNSGDVSGNHGGTDIWVVRVNSTGVIQWQKCFGGQFDEYSSNIQNTLDGNFIIVGSASSQNGDLISTNQNSTDVWVLKVNVSGNLIWQKSMGGSNEDIGYCIQELNLGQYILCGSAGSTGLINGDVVGNHGGSDKWLVKLVECNATTNSSSTINISSCSNYTTPTGQVLTNSGTYVEVIPNHLGCDSTITINFTKYSSVTNSVTVNTCFLPYTWNSQSYNSYGSYSQTLQTIDGCDSLVNLDLAYFPIWDNNICIVGLDQTTGKNKVVWEKEQTQVISGYNVYRENSQTGSFDLIGSTNYSDSSLFLDATANPIQQAYRYQITYVDTCGNESSAGSPHKTMHLTINQGVGTIWNLIWTPYSGISYPSYNIYRGTNPSNMTLLATVASNIISYTDANAPSGFIYYQIEIVGPNCNPTKSNYNNSRSNVSTNDPSYLGVNEEMMSPISIYPNPASNLININYNGKIDKVEILDAKGSVVFISKENKKEITLPTHLQTGFFMVVIHDEKQLFRKELLIQR
jgi:hypothetical protein